MNGNYTWASWDDVISWFAAGVYRLEDDRVFKGDRELSQRVNMRNGCDDGDPRVDLFHQGKRRSCHVSQLVWVWTTRTPIPDKFEIHHRDENIKSNGFDNLLLLHEMDHKKFHRAPVKDEEIPF